jgi:hypothetical protein
MAARKVYMSYEDLSRKLIDTNVVLPFWAETRRTQLAYCGVEEMYECRCNLGSQSTFDRPQSHTDYSQ